MDAVAEGNMRTAATGDVEVFSAIQQCRIVVRRGQRGNHMFATPDQAPADDGVLDSYPDEAGVQDRCEARHLLHRVLDRARIVAHQREHQQQVRQADQLKGVHVSVSFGVQPQPFLRGHGRIEEPVAARTELDPVGERHPEQLAEHQ